MSSTTALRLGTLAILCSSSFLFIKGSLNGLGPTQIVLARLWWALVLGAGSNLTSGAGRKQSRKARDSTQKPEGGGEQAQRYACRVSNLTGGVHLRLLPRAIETCDRTVGSLIVNAVRSRAQSRSGSPPSGQPEAS
jgi:hypothetical protein